MDKETSNIGCCSVGVFDVHCNPAAEGYRKLLKATANYQRPQKADKSKKKNAKVFSLLGFPKSYLQTFCSGTPQGNFIQYFPTFSHSLPPALTRTQNSCDHKCWSSIKMTVSMYFTIQPMTTMKKHYCIFM